MTQVESPAVVGRTGEPPSEPDRRVQRPAPRLDIEAVEPPVESDEALVNNAFALDSSYMGVAVRPGGPTGGWFRIFKVGGWFQGGADQLVAMDWTPGFATVHEEALGGALTSAPGATLWKNRQRIDVFARGLDSATWHHWRDYQQGVTGWNGPHSPPDNTSMTAVWSSADHLLHYAVRGTDKQFWTATWNESTFSSSGWGFTRPGPVEFTSACAGASPEINVMRLYARGADGYLYRTQGRQSTPSSWESWHRVGNQPVKLASAPTAVNWGWWAEEIFAMGVDGHVWNAYYRDQEGWNWEKLPKPNDSTAGLYRQATPIVVSHQVGTLDLFVPGHTKEFLTNRWKGTWHGWRGVVVPNHFYPVQ
ncbi:hypothetical protein ACIRL2_30660 [Embleya sp. NPDC127516]|uniref:hypothetical protein n=1 Tax=Embleya sp. NPDC127516 TaxID=3363990 RepID=UPI00382F61E2